MRFVTPRTSARKLGNFGKWLAAATLIVAAAVQEADAACARPCGSPVSGQPETPTAADSLYILRAAVGISSFCYACECDTDSNGNTTASDSLRTLRRSVGSPVSLNCPACGPVVSAQAFDRGRRALEVADITWANEQFACSVDADPGNAPAQFFYAASRVAAFVADNAGLDDLLIEIGGEGKTDLFDFTIKYPDGVELPTVARARPVLLQAFGDELEAAIDNLSEAISQSSFSTTITSAMVPGGLSEDHYEVDAADAAVLSAAYRKLRCLLYFSIGAYHSSTFDLLRDDPAIACSDGFVADHAQFFTLSSAAAMATAKAECQAAVDDAVTALDLLEAETDSQIDDLLLFDDFSQPSDPRDTRDVLAAVRDSFDQATADLPACDGTPVTVNGGRAFDQPLTRSELPELTEDSPGHCVVDQNTLPDLSFNGILPGAPTPETRTQLFSGSWPVCQPVNIPPYIWPF